MTAKPLDASVPANNEKIIEIYNKVKSGELNPSPDFQRKLVWKKQHKINFINTILLKYPFPEIYKAPGEMDVEKLKLADLIVDGQQRVTTIVNFIDGHDVFSSPSTKIKYDKLDPDEKKEFLNYEVSIRYLKNATRDQIKEIFQRINNTEYSLNSMERLNAKWGDSELVCYAKQLIEEEVSLNPEFVVFLLKEGDRSIFLDFFHNRGIFTENDNNRMLSLQFVLTLISTLIKGEYFSRNADTQKNIELYNEEFDHATEVTEGLKVVIDILNKLELEESSYWFNKSNIFTLICELYKRDTGNLDVAAFKKELQKFEGVYFEYLFGEQANIESRLIKYFDFAREGVNEISARVYRGSIISEIIDRSTN